MSYVSSMIVTCSLIEGEAVKALNGWCAAQERFTEFKQLDDDAAGGPKAMQVDVYAGAGNYYDEDLLLDVFPAFGWKWPEEAVLVVYPEDGPPRIARGDGRRLD